MAEWSLLLGELKSRSEQAVAAILGGAHASGLAQLGAVAEECGRYFGPRDVQTIRARANHASWTGECGDPARATELLDALAAHSASVLGADDPETLRIRNNAAAFLGLAGSPEQALAALQSLEHDYRQAFGRDSEDWRRLQANISAWDRAKGEKRT